MIFFIDASATTSPELALRVITLELSHDSLLTNHHLVGIDAELKGQLIVVNHTFM